MYIVNLFCLGTSGGASHPSATGYCRLQTEKDGNTHSTEFRRIIAFGDEHLAELWALDNGLSKLKKPVQLNIHYFNNQLSEVISSLEERAEAGWHKGPWALDFNAYYKRLYEASQYHDIQYTHYGFLPTAQDFQELACAA